MDHHVDAGTFRDDAFAGKFPGYAFSIIFVSQLTVRSLTINFLLQYTDDSEEEEDDSEEEEDDRKPKAVDKKKRKHENGGKLPPDNGEEEEDDDEEEDQNSLDRKPKAVEKKKRKHNNGGVDERKCYFFIFDGVCIPTDCQQPYTYFHSTINWQTSKECNPR
jgi:hypothetical protein